MKTKSKKIAYFLMVILIFLWGFDYIVAKNALKVCEPLTLIFIRYVFGVLIILAIKLVTNRKFTLRKKDILFLIVCAIFGELIYFGAEYTALSYLPVSIVTLVLSLVPVVSIIIEFFLYKRRPSVAVIIGCFVSIFGIALIVGADISELLSGKLTGYLLVLAALISWNIYNFMTAKLTNHYSPFELTLYQLLAAIVVSAPYAVFNMPDASDIDTMFVLSIAYLAVVSSVICFIIYVNSIKVVGVTPTALFANMLPVTSTLMGWIFLGEMISPIQMIGGVIVIVAGSVVIYLKNKNDERALKE